MRLMGSGDMRACVLVAALLIFFDSDARAADSTVQADSVAEAGEPEAGTASENESDPGAPSVGGTTATLCFFAGGPPPDVKYEVIRKLKAGKGTYGSVKDVLPRLASLAISRGADAVINYNGSQRFGVFPWRLVRPVVSGEAVRWLESPKQDCHSMGGATLQSMLDTNKPPGTSVE